MPRTFPWTMLQRWAREHRTSRAASARFNIAGALVSFKSPTDSSDLFWLPEGADTGWAGEADIVFSAFFVFRAPATAKILEPAAHVSATRSR
jgi:hypothetical protein